MESWSDGVLRSVVSFVFIFLFCEFGKAFFTAEAQRGKPQPKGQNQINHTGAKTQRKEEKKELRTDFTDGTDGNKKKHNNAKTLRKMMSFEKLHCGERGG